MPTIKTITIEYAYTFNLGNYSNVRPVVTLTADLAGGDDPELVILDLQEQARLAVQEEIDTALTTAGRPPHFRQAEPKNEAKAIDEIEVPF